MNRSYKNTVIAVLLACILTMAIGYAVLNQRLNISGTSKITSDFNIQVVGISEFKKEGLAETANMDFTPTSATYSTNLQIPGDYIFYEIVIENKGNIPGYVYFEKDGNNNYYGDKYNSDETLNVSVFSASKEPRDPADEFNFPEETDQYTYLNSGEKLYVYASAVFEDYATEIPEEKEISLTVNFNFTSAINSTLVATKDLHDAILDSQELVTSGNGLYKIENSVGGDNDNYIFKSDATGDVNNYVLIGDKMWRLLSFNTNRDYIVVEDNTNINPKTIYSSTKNSDDDYYNHYINSDLVNFLKEELYNMNFVTGSFIYTSSNYVYIENTSMGSYTRNTVRVPLYGVLNIMNASTNTNCSFNTLSTGGCKSWLTNNGDTFLINPIYSDESTNTGKISYLEDGKIIGVDPQDINYGKYLLYGEITTDCNDPAITNLFEADGSRENPYILDVREQECSSVVPE